MLEVQIQTNIHQVVALSVLEILSILCLQHLLYQLEI